jgi:hypothetical protein
MLETIEQKVKSHDRSQVEIKRDYQLLQGKKTCYRVSTYIFIPHTLGINPGTYTKQDFYRDIKNYIRLKTPELILREFREHPISPLVRVKSITSAVDWASDPSSRDSLVRNLKLLSAMLKTSTREHMRLISRRIAEAGPDTKLYALIGNLVEEFLVETERIAKAYRELYPAFNLPNVDQAVFSAYRYTDEYISLLIEENAVELYQVVDEHLGRKGEKAGFKDALIACAEAETQYRRSHGYASILHRDNDDNEVFTLQASMLKKYASSVLFLDTDRREEGAGMRQLLYAIAAGLSMLFATVLAFFFQQRFGNFTFALLAALVIGYMFKDRIKEITRGILSRFLQERVYDHRIVIRPQDSHEKLGVLKEKMTFVRREEVPTAVRRRRIRFDEPGIESDGQYEYVIRHSKEIVLYRDAFEKALPGLPDITGINDITRYDISVYLRKMDEPLEEYTTLDEDGVHTVIGHRVYRVNFVSKYKSVVPQKEKTYSRVQLVLNRDGIRRVEHLPV